MSLRYYYYYNMLADIVTARQHKVAMLITAVDAPLRWCCLLSVFAMPHSVTRALMARRGVAASTHCHSNVTLSQQMALRAGRARCAFFRCRLRYAYLPPKHYAILRHYCRHYFFFAHTDAAITLCRYALITLDDSHDSYDIDATYCHYLPLRCVTLATPLLRQRRFLFAMPPDIRYYCLRATPLRHYFRRRHDTSLFSFIAAVYISLAICHAACYDGHYAFAPLLSRYLRA